MDIFVMTDRHTNASLYNIDLYVYCFIHELLYPQTRVSSLQDSSVWLKKTLRVEFIADTRVFKAQNAELA